MGQPAQPSQFARSKGIRKGCAQGRGTFQMFLDGLYFIFGLMGNVFHGRYSYVCYLIYSILSQEYVTMYSVHFFLSICKWFSIKIRKKHKLFDFL